MIDTTDEQLVVQAQGGGTAALGQLYDRYVNEIFRFTLLRIGNKEEAEDVTATIFLKVVDKLGTYSEKKASFRTWLYTIARRTIIDSYRKQKPTTDIAALEVASGAATDLLTHATVGHILAGLDPEQREIVVLKAVEGLTFHEIGAILGVSESAAKMRFYRTMEGLVATHGPAVMVLLASYVA